MEPHRTLISRRYGSRWPVRCLDLSSLFPSFTSAISPSATISQAFVFDASTACAAFIDCRSCDKRAILRALKWHVAQVMPHGSRVRVRAEQTKFLGNRKRRDMLRDDGLEPFIVQCAGLNELKNAALSERHARRTRDACGTPEASSA